MPNQIYVRMWGSFPFQYWNQSVVAVWNWTGSWTAPTYVHTPVWTIHCSLCLSARIGIQIQVVSGWYTDRICWLRTVSLYNFNVLFYISVRARFRAHFICIIHLLIYVLWYIICCTAVLYQALLLTYHTIANANSLFVLVIERPYYLCPATKVLSSW